jgi:hypothetical protein
MPFMILPWTPTCKKRVIPKALSISVLGVVFRLKALTLEYGAKGGPGNFARGWKNLRYKELMRGMLRT